MVRGIGGNMSPHIQPSLHIGINPVPALIPEASGPPVYAAENAGYEGMLEDLYGVNS